MDERLAVSAVGGVGATALDGEVWPARADRTRAKTIRGAYSIRDRNFDLYAPEEVDGPGIYTTTARQSHSSWVELSRKWVTASNDHVLTRMEQFH